MASEENDASRWCKLAAEARTLAAAMSDAAASRIMLQIAKSYDRLAALANKRGMLEAAPGAAPEC
jgi:hypothetical protein